jgi:hypothetical protein
MTNDDETKIIIVPAAARQFATVLTIGNDDRGRPRETRAQRVPIVAWRIEAWDEENYVAMPILAGGMSVISNQRVLIEWADSLYDDPFSATYTSLDQAKSEVLKEFQRAWDDKQEHEKQLNKRKRDLKICGEANARNVQ